MAAGKAGKKPDSPESNLVAIVAVIGLIALSYFDLQNASASIPNFIYYGLIGAMLGAKWESVRDWIRGKR